MVNELHDESESGWNASDGDDAPLLQRSLPTSDCAAQLTSVRSLESTDEPQVRLSPKFGAHLNSICNAGPDEAPSFGLILALLVWYGAHAYSVVVSGSLIRDHLPLHPLGHLTVTVAQVQAGVVMSSIYVACASYAGCGMGTVDMCCARPLFGKATSALGWALVLIAGLCQFVGIAGTNASMASAGAATTQVLKATEPMFTALLQYVILRKSSSPLDFFALVLIASGTLITSATQSGSRLVISRTVLPALCSSVSLPLMRVVTKVSEFPRASSGATVLLLLTIVGALPATIVLAYIFSSIGPPPADIRFIWSAISFNAYQLASLSVLHQLDAVKHSIGNAFKRVIVIALSVVLFGEQLSTHRAIGLAVCFTGILLHMEQSLPGSFRARGCAAVLRVSCVASLPIGMLMIQAE